MALAVYPCSVFLDLCKASDTVDHQILLANLEYYGMQGVANDWFASYLSNRRQFVSLFDTNSDYQLKLFFDPSLNWKPSYMNSTRKFQEVLDCYLNIGCFVSMRNKLHLQ